MQKLYLGGPILTMEHHPVAQALVTEKGKIVYTGDLAEAEARFPAAQRVKLGGKALIPGFVDAHSHFSAVAGQLLQCSVVGCSSFDQIAQRLSDFVREKALSPGQWVIAFGYDQTALRENRHPDKGLLDGCCPNHPAMLQHASNHSGVLNSQALKALGLRGDTSDPAGGAFGRDGAELTGYVEENAWFQAQAQAPMPDLAQMMEGYRQAQQLYASYGITTVQEGMATAAMIPLYQQLLRESFLRLDIVAYAGMEEEAAVYHAFSAHTGDYRQHFRLGGCKIFLDGSPQNRTAWLRQPYRDSQDRGYGVMQEDAVRQAVRFCAQKKRQLLAHCNGDAAAEQFLQALDSAERAGEGRPVRPVMIHAQLLGLDQMDALRRLGVTPSFFVAHVWHWGDVHRKNLGDERAAHISPAAAALRAGVRFTFHQDAPVIPPDMMETVWCACVRKSRQGVYLGKEQRIPVWEALKAVTLNAAWQYGEDQSKGSLRPGKRADLAILSRDPLKTPPEQLRSIMVEETIKDGETIYRRTHTKK